MAESRGGMQGNGGSLTPMTRFKAGILAFAILPLSACSHDEGRASSSSATTSDPASAASSPATGEWQFVGRDVAVGLYVRPNGEGIIVYGDPAAAHRRDSSQPGVGFRVMATSVPDSREVRLELREFRGQATEPTCVLRLDANDDHTQLCGNLSGAMPMDGCLVRLRDRLSAETDAWMRSMQR